MIQRVLMSDVQGEFAVQVVIHIDVDRFWVRNRQRLRPWHLRVQLDGLPYALERNLCTESALAPFQCHEPAHLVVDLNFLLGHGILVD